MYILQHVHTIGLAGHMHVMFPSTAVTMSGDTCEVALMWWLTLSPSPPLMCVWVQTVMTLLYDEATHQRREVVIMLLANNY